MNKLRKVVRGKLLPFHPMRLALLALSAQLAGCYSAPPSPQPDTPQVAPGMAMQDVTFYSAALQRQMPYRLYLPAKIAPGKKLPAVYLLHGSGGDYRNWSNYSDVAMYAAERSLILVMVEGGSSYYVNSALIPQDKYEDYVLNDLIADVESRFPAARVRESRAIIGYSMGGYAAVKFALTRPDLFVFAGAFSPAIDVPSRRFTFRRWGQSMRFRQIFGSDGSQTRRQADPFLLLRSANPADTPYLYLTAGKQEPLLEPNQRFVALLKQRNFAYEFHTRPGGHDWGEWSQEIPGCFDALLKHIKQPG
jgi:putative tributyrin esterase